MITTKVCTKCKRELEIYHFIKNDLEKKICDECRKKINEKNKEYYKLHPKKLEEARKYSRENAKKHKEKAKQRKRELYQHRKLIHGIGKLETQRKRDLEWHKKNDLFRVRKKADKTTKKDIDKDSHLDDLLKMFE